MSQIRKGKSCLHALLTLKRHSTRFCLYKKLESNNINGNFLYLLMDIYKKTKCGVKINNKITNLFQYEKGVKQGDPFSPLLFNIFINYLFTVLNNSTL